MPIEESRLKTGTLTLNALPFAKQATSVSLVPSTSTEGDPVEALDGSTITADETSTWSLNLGLIQDFDDPAGIIEWLRANAGTEKAFSWEPNAVDAPTYSGTVRVRPTTIGGGVNVRLTSEVELPVSGEPAVLYPV